MFDSIQPRPHFKPGPAKPSYLSLSKLDKSQNSCAWSRPIVQRTQTIHLQLSLACFRRRVYVAG
jgi:hypothetical protein